MAWKQVTHVIFLFLLCLMYVIIRCILLTGIIASYGLWLDGVLILNSSSSQRFFVVEGLSPWSRHVLRLQACTAQGCGKGPMVSESLAGKHSNECIINKINCEIHYEIQKKSSRGYTYSNIYKVYVCCACVCVCVCVCHWAS